MDVDLHRACSCGDLEGVKRLLLEGADPHSVNSDQETLLHAACYGENLNLVRYLIEEKGLDVNHRAGTVLSTQDGGTMDSVSTGESPPGYTPLHVACEDPCLEMVKYLVEHGADINLADEEGQTALHIAAGHEDKIEVFKYLLKSGANITIKNVAGMNALHTSVLCGNIQVVKFFIGNNVDIMTSDIKNLLHYSCCGGHFTMFQLFLGAIGLPLSETGFDPKHLANGESYLHKLCRGKHNARQSLSMAKYLVELKVSVDCRNVEYWTPLHVACSEGFVDMVMFLLDKNVSLYATTTDGMTAAHLGIWNKDIIVTLINHGMTMELRDNYGRTPLLLLCSSKAGWYHKHLRLKEEEKLEIVRVLLENGSDVNAIDLCDSTPLLEVCSASFQYTDLTKYLVQHGATVNVVDNQRRTPLHEACERNNEQIVSILVENGACVNCVDAECNTPLHLAVSQDGDTREIVQTLSEVSSTDVNKRNARGKTPLHILCHKRLDQAHVDMALCLLRQRAQVNIEDRYSNTPLENALEMCTNFQGTRCFKDTQETDLHALKVISKILEYPAKFPTAIYFRTGVMSLFVRAGLQNDKLYAEYFAEAVSSEFLPLQNLVARVDSGLRHSAQEILSLIDNNFIYFSHYRDIRLSLNRIQSQPNSLSNLCIFSVRSHLRKLQPGYSILYRINKLPLPRHSLLRQIRLDNLIEAIYPMLNV